MPAHTLEKPCVQITCDGCGEGDNYDFGGWFHYESLEQAIQAVQDADWHVVRDEQGNPIEFYHEDCWDEQQAEADDQD